MAAKLNNLDSKKRNRNLVDGIENTPNQPEKRLKVVNLIEGSRQSAFAAGNFITKAPPAPEKKSARLAKI